MGACAGLCYNALWYFPILILIGGVATVVWDVWLLQMVGKMRAKWETNRRRTTNEGGDAERFNTSQNIPLKEYAHATPATLNQRKPQAEGSEGHTSTDRDPTGQDSFANSWSHEGAESAEAAPVADTKTHNISIMLGISLIVGFLSTSQLPLFKRILTLKQSRL
jgi:hypothetical protein